LLETFCDLLSESWQRCAALEQLGEAFERAKAMSRAKTVFLANMSHDIRTPMNVILGFTELMQRRAGLDPEIQEQLETIGRAGHHLLALINNVLEISRIESGRAELGLCAFDIHEMLDDMARMFRIRAEDRGVDLVLHRADAVPRLIRSDQARLRQVLINLLGNAVKYTDCGQISIRAEVVSEVPPEVRQAQQRRTTAARRRKPAGTRTSPPLFLQIEVSDTGVGIAASETQRIFEPFFQSQQSAQAFDGTGLGLAIARENLELMDGGLWVSSAVGMGSTFTCVVPLEEVSGDEAVLEQQPRRIIGLGSEQPAPRILVVDDDGPNRRLLSRLLEDVGFAVLQATDGREAVAIVSSAHPDLVLMDLNMPRMSGIEATRRIRRLEPGRGLKIIAVSARAFDDARSRALEAGVDDHVRKPFRIDDVLETVGRQLGISYVYAGPEPGMSTRSAGSAQEPAASGPGAPMTEAELGQHLGRLPATLVEQLRAAAIRADIDRLSGLIATAAEHDQAAAAHLGRLANGFAYDRIESLLTAAPPPAGRAGQPSQHAAADETGIGETGIGETAGEAPPSGPDSPGSPGRSRS
jgi:signal transduction histidine kinase/CheY-like chemotaxis protein